MFSQNYDSIISCYTTSVEVSLRARVYISTRDDAILAPVVYVLTYASDPHLSHVTSCQFPSIFCVLTGFPSCFSLGVIGLCIYTRFSWFSVTWVLDSLLALSLAPCSCSFFATFCVSFPTHVLDSDLFCSLHSVLPAWFCCIPLCKSSLICTVTSASL